MKHITSRDNPTYKLLRDLSESARERRKLGRAILDGLHLVEAFMRFVGAPELLAVSERGRGQGEIQAFLGAHPAANVVILSDTLFKEISPVATPAGLLALVTIPRPRALHLTQDSCVVLDAVQDAGNVGSILRSAAAAGMEDVILGKGCAQAWSPKVLRAAMGAHFVLNLHEHLPVPDALAGYRGSVIATALSGGESVFQVDLTGPVAWVFGNEGAGVGAELAALAQRRVFVPMSDKVESLNVAAAVAVCLFEQRRQQLQSGRTAPAGLRRHAGPA